MAFRARHTPVLSGDRKIRAVSADAALFPHLGDAITALADEDTWQEVGDTIGEIVAECKSIVENWYSDMLIGAILPWLINPPSGWLLLDGGTYASADYPELSALLPAHLISGSNFTLPDVENAFPFGVLDEDDAGAVTGTNVLNLAVGQLPAHTHTYLPPVLTVETGGAGVPIPAAGIGSAIATSSTGSGDDIDKRPQRFGLVYAVYAGRE